MVPSIVELIASKRFSLENEKALQRQIYDVITGHYPLAVREKTLDKKSIIDIFVDGVGIEVKIKGSKREIYKQCVRYCQFDEITSLILVSSVITGFPKEINGKNCWVVNLSKAWL